MELTQITENKELMKQLAIMFNPTPRYIVDCKINPNAVRTKKISFL